MSDIISTFELATKAMFVMGLFVFVCLYFVDAGYGKFRSDKWGYSINNKLGWFIMEFPALIPVGYAVIFILDCNINNLPSIPLMYYILHYIYRSLIFPFLLKGKSQMPLAIALMGSTFNLVNSTLISFYTVYLPLTKPATAGLHNPWIYMLGFFLMIYGFNIHRKADHTIRNLRKPGDTKHYLPTGGLFNYVTSANYLGELVEWIGFALMVNNPAGWMFVWWTAANLVPRAHAINKKYRAEFGDEAVGKRKRIIPFIY